MKTQKTQASLFLVLVPHRDVRLELRKYCAELFNQGFMGAFDFPLVAPLASLSKPLGIEELKHCARVVRQAAGKDKFTIFGPRLDLTFSKDALGSDKIVSLFSPTMPDTIPWLPLSFRVAAVANMLYRPLRERGENGQFMDIGYKWKIGRLCWLPKKPDISS